MAGEPDQEGVAAMTALERLLPRLLMVGVFLIVLAGCVPVEGGYYGYYGGAPGYDLDYYGGYGLGYGNWGPTYGVGPFFGGRGFDRNHDRFQHGGPPGAHGFRAAPSSRPIPSIPSERRGGGGFAGGGQHGGGGHGGGGHGGGGHGGGGGRNH